ncbi:Glutathione-independent glyoxalase DJ-1 [Smittium culicis]|uniref:D-lactate dehydratase n=1 Tax=Smittium culicis TaxID=133412 RepID=A0A1R1YFQ5_9FUNG|nr:Glutathione-independent glyoxalase DJ-1 [Smittium culicis]
MSKVNKAIIFITDGTEEIEATVTIDVLRRAGIEVLVCGVSEQRLPYYTCSRLLKIVPDVVLDFDLINFDNFNAVIIPGGAEGAKTLSENDQVQRILADFYAQGKVVATICAGCLAIKTAKLHNKKGIKLMITGHPSVRNALKDDFDFLSDRVVTDNHLITA